MNKPDTTEILNKEISYLVDTMKDSMEYIGRKYDLNDFQISEMEKDFIARLAFAAIKYGVNKEEEEDCESCPAKNHCSFKEDEKEPEKKPEKSDGLPSNVINALLYVKRLCEDHECDDCPFASSDDLFCRLIEIPKDWEV